MPYAELIVHKHGNLNFEGSVAEHGMEIDGSMPW